MRIKARTPDGQEYYIVAINDYSAYVVDKIGRIGRCNLGDIEVIDTAYLPKGKVTENE